MDLSNQPGLWNEAIETFPEAGVGHLYDWRKVIKRAYGMESLHLAALDGSRVRGLLPLTFIKSRIFGRSLVSMPYLNDGGILANDHESELLLWNEAKKRMKNSSVAYLELRHSHSVELDVSPRLDKINMVLDLRGGRDDTWMKLHSNVRNKIRKSEKLGIEVKCGPEYLQDFFTAHVVNMQELGSPPHSLRFFSEIVDTFGDRVKVYSAYEGGRAIGGKVVLYMNNALHFLWASLPREFHRFAAVSLLNWRAIEDGIERGAQFCYFGRSSADSSHFDFKKKWGAETRQLYWHVYPASTEAQAKEKIDSWKYSAFIKVWQRLPVSVVKLVGPMLRGGLPQ